MNVLKIMVPTERVERLVRMLGSASSSNLNNGSMGSSASGASGASGASSGVVTSSRFIQRFKREGERRTTNLGTTTIDSNSSSNEYGSSGSGGRVFAGEGWDWKEKVYVATQ